MSYTLIIKRQAKHKLQSIGRTDRIRITEKISLLGQNPHNPLLDVKRLEGQVFYRLRVGSWRVIFDRQDAIKIIAIEKIASRGDVYK